MSHATANTAKYSGFRLPIGRIVHVLPWVISALVLVLLSAAIPFAQLNNEGLIGAPYLVAVLAYAFMGAVVASRRPDNPIGWLQLFCASIFSLSVLTSEYARYALAQSPQLPMARGMAWPESFLVIFAITPALSIIPLLFPTGEPLSARWGKLVRIISGSMVLFALFAAVRPGTIPADSPITVENPFGIDALAPWATAIDTIFTVLLIGSVLAGAISLILRFRQGSDVVRQQVKWVAASVTGWFVAVLLTYPSGRIDPDLLFANEILLALMFAAIPLSTGIAILRWRLYDIDLIVNRAIVYGALTAGVSGIYVLVVGVLGAQIGSRGNLVVSLVATGIVAVLFQPLRSRVQRFVDRFIYGDRSEPYDVLTRLGLQLEASVRTDDLLTAIVRSIRTALKLPYAAISIQRVRGLTVVAEDGAAPVRPHISYPLTYQGEAVGALALAHRTGETSLSPADRTLLGDLARQIAPAVHGIRVMGDLQRSREQLVTAREEERRRLRHDLHDGLGPALASLSLQLAAVRSRVAVLDPETADQIGVIKTQVHDAVSDIRRLVYGLRPPALDELGLGGAIREHAARLSGENMRVTVEAVDDFPVLPAAVEVAAYRIALEAMTNVARHSAARRAWVSIDIIDDPARELVIMIADDGRGIEPGATIGAGTTSMRERAAELGGKFEITTVQTGGVRVSANIPLESAESATPVFTP